MLPVAAASAIALAYINHSKTKEHRVVTVPLIQAMSPSHKRFFFALANQGKIPLELIEVQTGSYLGEDDIERIEDVYERN
jgi:hypothetical protein